MSVMMARSTEDVFEDNLRLRKDGNLEQDLRNNYHEDVVLLTGYGVFRGHDGVRESATILNKYIPEGNYEYRTKCVDGEVAYLEWTAEGDGKIVQNGADTFVICDGLIVVQTIYYTVTLFPQR
jgi:hypothetical protein